MSRQDAVPVPPACASVRADLPGLDGHELSTRRVTEIRAHLAGCPSCAGLAGSYRAVRRTLSDLHQVRVGPPPDLLARLLDDAAQPGVRERVAVLGRGAVSGARPRVLAAGAGVGAVAGIGVGVIAWRALRARRVPA